MTMLFRYGMDFLQHAYLYHLGRKDHRHSFSIYFYYIYLTFEQATSFQVALATFAPQFLIVFLCGLLYSDDIIFAVFLQTFLFVTFNKVCTSQVSDYSYNLYE
jgi:phosphatidylinositol glycan class M